MAEPVLSPNDTLAGVEATRSTSPVQGGGLQIEQRSLSHETLFPGRVEDGYPSAGGYLVAVYNFKRNLPCYPLQPADGRFFGAAHHAPIPVGTEVMVYLPRDGKFGYILGVLPTVQDPPHQRASGQLVPEGGVNAFSDAEAFSAPDFGLGGLLPQASSAQPVDALPGDVGVLNEFNVGYGVNRLMAFLKAGDLAGVEAFLLEDLLRLVGDRLEIFTSLGEERTNNDYGRIGRERLSALTQAESLGASGDGADTCAPNPSATLTRAPDESSLKAVTEGAVGRWRAREDEGYLGDFLQRFLARPSATPRALDGSVPPPDLTLYQEFLSRCGQHLERSLVGGGLAKSLGMAGPRRLRVDDDPAGDRTIADPAPRKPFSLTPSGGPGPAGFGAMVRDFLAWEFDQRAKWARADLARDWQTDDDAAAATPEGTTASFTTPGVGGFFRDFPPLSDAARAAGTVTDETATASTPYRPGEAFALLLPDGSVQARDAWGSEIRMRGGHVDVTCSHDLNLSAGGSIVLQAGDDLVLRARQAVDVSSTNNQVRVKGGKDLLFHTEEGGMLFSAPAAGQYSGADSRGEQLSLAGIAFTTGGGLTVSAQTADFALGEYFYVTGQQQDTPPAIYLQGQDVLVWSYGALAFATDQNGDEGIFFSEGGVYGTGDFETDGSMYARKDMVAGGDSGGNADFDNDPTVASQLQGVFVDSQWTQFQAPYTYADLGTLQFTFRSTPECAAGDLQAFEAAWQRELSDGLSAWREQPVNGTYPWPGQSHYGGGGRSYFTYQEANVGTSGVPKPRNAQTPQGGTFTPQDFQSIKTLDR